MTVFVSALVPTLVGAEISDRPRSVVLNTDLYSEVITRRAKEGLHDSDVEELVKNARQHGVDVINLRVTWIDPENPSDTWLSRMDVGEAKQFASTYSANKLEQYLETQGSASEIMVKTFQRFDPVKSFVKHAKKHGIKIFAWIDIYDHWIPGKGEEYLAARPYLQWTSRDGQYFRGIYSYAWAESRERRLAQIRHFLEQGFDGVHLSLSSHARHYHEPVEERNIYGFEKPVIEACLARGVDIRTDTFDQEVWQQIKGDFVIDLYRGAKALCQKHDADLSLGIGFGSETQFASPYWSGNILCSYDNRWKSLLEEVKPDVIVLGEYEPVLNDIVKHPRYKPGSVGPYWAAKGVAEDGEKRLEEYRQFVRDMQKQHPAIQWALHCNYLPTSRDSQTRVLGDWLRVAGAAGVDAIYIHEAYSFQQPETGFDLLSGALEETGFSSAKSSERIE